jgi:hypothetical protein
MRARLRGTPRTARLCVDAERDADFDPERESLVGPERIIAVESSAEHVLTLDRGEPYPHRSRPTIVGRVRAVEPLIVDCEVALEFDGGGWGRSD